jgi:hypothetical protein
MDSSFFTVIYLISGILALTLFLKMIIQFGLPNHPLRFISYLVGFCMVALTVGLALTDLNYISPWDWIRIRSLPLIAGSLCLLIQTIMLAGSFTLIQQKIFSRLPFMAALLCFAFFYEFADVLASIFLILGALFLIISVKKARQQKRLYYKMLGMFLLDALLRRSGFYWGYLAGQLFFMLGIFFLFLFEQSFAITALIDDFRRNDAEGELS